MIEANASDPIRFCHIAPTKYLNTFTFTNGAHLLLAHLVEDDAQYADYYSNLSDGKVKILDNSAFEMFKRGQPMYESSKLISMAKRCKADVIVMSDYPREPWTKTKKAASSLISHFKDAGFGTFYVPQSEFCDQAGLIQSFEWALENKEIDLIGVSILACPIALGVDENAYSIKQHNDAYKLQRFMSRWKIFNILEKKRLLGSNAIKRFHCLGMTDGPNEIDLLRPYHDYIFSWDSSAAVWAGLNHIQFDSSPTGLSNGKFETEVDFSFSSMTGVGKDLVDANIFHVNSLCRR
jgi:hypothetical protein